MEESVSDSEVDFFNPKSEQNLPRKGTRRWAYAVRRSSIGWSPQSVHTDRTANHSGEAAIQPERIVELLRSPSVQTYTTLKRKLLKAKSNPEWILRFLHSDGLELLFDSLEQISRQNPKSFLDAVLQVGCSECVKTVMDSSLGLDYIVENKDFTRKFAAGMYSFLIFLSYFVLRLGCHNFMELYWRRDRTGDTVQVGSMFAVIRTPVLKAQVSLTCNTEPINLPTMSNLVSFTWSNTERIIHNLFLASQIMLDFPL